MNVFLCRRHWAINIFKRVGRGDIDNHSVSRSRHEAQLFPACMGSSGVQELVKPGGPGSPVSKDTDFLAHFRN